MAKIKKITLNINEFFEAVSKLPVMRRSPNGSRGKIPKDTIISSIPSGVKVDTPVSCAHIKGQGVFDGEISVDAQILFKVVERNKQMTDHSNNKGKIELWIEDGELRIKGYVDTRLPPYQK